MNHFELFGLDASVDLDVKQLENTHRLLSAEAHPDRLVGADAATRRAAVERSATLNDAIKVLRDPFRRALYILKLQGINLDEPGVPVLLPESFLEEIIERRERLEDAKESGTTAEIDRLAAEAAGHKRALFEEAQANLRAAKPKEAAVALARVRYYGRFLDEVEIIRGDE
jgi:molecular chaperone HscB